MKQNIILGITALLFLIIIISGCTQKIEVPPQFDIYYSWGYQGKNILDTKNNIYIKDMVLDPQREYTMQLNNEDKTKIYNSIIENDLLNMQNGYLFNFTAEYCETNICASDSSSEVVTLKIIINGETKKIIKWDRNDPYNTEDIDLKKFQNVEKVIQDIISQKEDEMNIEQPTSGYG